MRTTSMLPQFARTLTMLLVLACSFLACFDARAQSSAPGVELIAPDGPVYVGESFTLRLRSTIGEIESISMPPIVDGLRMERGMSSSSQSIRIINGQQIVQAEDSIDLVAMASRTGTVTIPAISLRVGGVDRSTAPVMIRVVEPEAAQGFPLRLTLDAQEAYVGQAIQAELRWRVDAKQRNWQIVGLSGPYDVIPRNDATGMSGDTFPADLDGRRAIAHVEPLAFEGRTVPEVIVPFAIVPRASGEIDLSSVAVVFDEVVGVDRSGGSLFGPRDLTTRRISQAPSVRLHVNALPETNRPADFSGIVGSCELDATLSPRTASVGDPLTLSIRLRSDAPIDRVLPPDLGAITGLDDAFKLDPRGWESQGIGSGQRVWTTTVRARSGEVNAFPPLSISFFDPERGTYERASSEAIPLEVREVRRVTLDDASVSPGSPARPPLKSMPPGPPTLARSIGTVVDADALGARTTEWSTVALVGAAGPATTLVAWAAGTLLARRRPDAAQRRAWKRDAISELRGRELTPERVRRALACAACSVDAPLHEGGPEAMSAEEAAERLAPGLDATSADQLCAVAHWASAARYAPSNGTTAPLPIAASEVAPLVRRGLRARGSTRSTEGAR
ncbi:MAG: BatD family protein [Phycisphaerales bacterium]|jgi:hypothetical protein|nr:BatD family protein [Phycisphaerales bacterium]